MKISIYFYVALTTFLLILVAFMVFMNIPVKWVFYIITIGQVSILVMVNKVLKEEYTTNKTFDHFYNDNPMLTKY